MNIEHWVKRIGANIMSIFAYVLYNRPNQHKQI